MPRLYTRRWRPRWFACLYAKALGYFWLPCPSCGRNFGGHEWAKRRRLSGDWEYLSFQGSGICADAYCIQKAESCEQVTFNWMESQVPVVSEQVPDLRPRRMVELP